MVLLFSTAPLASSTSFMPLVSRRATTVWLSIMSTSYSRTCSSNAEAIFGPSVSFTEISSQCLRCLTPDHRSALTPRQYECLYEPHKLQQQRPQAHHLQLIHRKVLWHLS